MIPDETPGRRRVFFSRAHEVRYDETLRAFRNRRARALARTLYGATFFSIFWSKGRFSSSSKLPVSFPPALEFAFKRPSYVRARGENARSGTGARALLSEVALKDARNSPDTYIRAVLNYIVARKIGGLPRREPGNIGISWKQEVIHSHVKAES